VVVRLFTGIPLPREVTNQLTRLLDYLRPTAHLRWSPAYNLHVTTKFIGEWPEDRLQELVEALQPLGRRKPIEICVNGIGWMPNPHSPRVLFCGIKAGPELAQLARDTEDALESLGIERERREYKPHLTLARIKDPAISLVQLRHAIASLESTDLGCFTTPSFKLYLSKLGPAGSIYTQLAEIPLSE
jgi:2'-5' RNA ligase